MNMSDTTAIASDDVEKSEYLERLNLLKNGHHSGMGPLPRNFLATLLEKEPSALKYLDGDPCEDLLIFAARKNPEVLRYVRNCSDKLVTAVLTVNPFAIAHVPNPTHGQQRLALTGNHKDGKINAKVLASCGNFISPTVVDQVEPGLSFVLNLLADGTKVQRERVIKNFLAQPKTGASTPVFGEMRIPVFGGMHF